MENARRRIADQGRYDDGVARLYRAVEMWHQWRLKDLNSVSTKKVDWKGIPEDVASEFLHENPPAELPSELDLTRARTLDRLLNGDLNKDTNVLRDLLQQRNNSILAHGLEPLGEKAARKFLEYVDAMVLHSEGRYPAAHAKLGINSRHFRATGGIL